jgi:NitT/TauT family transport system substrate-binding protein
LKLLGEETVAMQIFQNRRRFLTHISAAGAAGLFGVRPSLAAELPPEVATVRIAKIGGICLAPQYVAEELLRAEGFIDVRYVELEADIALSEAIGRGEIDFTSDFAAEIVAGIDAGHPVTAIAGIHVGCFELFGNERIRRLTDLKAKTVGVQGYGTSPHLFLSSMATSVGIDPVDDIDWVFTSPSVKPMELFAEGKVDAFLGFPPEPQELRARGIGQVVVNSAIDRPWSQYFCCLLTGRRQFVREHPIATKRVARAMLKAADLCAAEPARMARQVVDEGFTPNYDYALQTLTEVPYNVWREYDPEDTLRFYALRLHEAGMISSTPQQILAAGSDFRFFEELKRELKA